ncbi:MAG: sugar-binding transcriptional regulator [Chloroflexi bacterium]|nr:sugar-binding transcriptional regulator [Chloroflexota bacterium]
MAHLEELRLMARVAHLYYNQGLSQSEIAKRLDLSQTTISRLHKRAIAEKIIRITVSMPPGVYVELEEALRQKYNIKDVIIADSQSQRLDDLQRAIGAAAAYYIETTLGKDEVVGISSWSSTLLAMVDAMHPVNSKINAQIVQILGGIGNSEAEKHAARLGHRLAELLHGTAVFLSAPGIVGSADAKRVLLEDPYVAQTVAMFDQVTLALVGIGALEPSELLASSGNTFSSDETQVLRECGAIGDICQRFFDADGQPVDTPLNDRVIGMPLAQLKNIRRTVAVAGGAHKVKAIRGALVGGIVNVLVTDQATAQALIDD